MPQVSFDLLLPGIYSVYLDKTIEQRFIMLCKKNRTSLDAYRDRNRLCTAAYLYEPSQKAQHIHSHCLGLKFFPGHIFMGTHYLGLSYFKSTHTGSLKSVISYDVKAVELN